MSKPLTEYQRNAAFAYLDELRDSGKVQMDNGYTPTYLCDVFGHSYGTAWDLLQEWRGPVEPITAPEPTVRIQQHDADGSGTAHTTVEFTFAGTFEMLMALLHGMAEAEQRGKHDRV